MGVWKWMEEDGIARIELVHILGVGVSRNLRNLLKSFIVTKNHNTCLAKTKFI